MNELHQFMIKAFEKTKWPFFPVVALKVAFGASTIVQLNELREKGIVKKVKGINGSLVELLQTF